MMICDETIMKLMRTHHKHAQLHSCLNKLNLTLNIHTCMCFLVGRNVDIDIVGLRQQNIRFCAEFYRPYSICVLKLCLPYINNRPTRFPMLQNLGIESKCMSLSQMQKELWPF